MALFDPFPCMRGGPAHATDGARRPDKTSYATPGDSGSAALSGRGCQKLNVPQATMRGSMAGHAKVREWWQRGTFRGIERCVYTRIAIIIGI